jgi:hypothetical protein
MIRSSLVFSRAPGAARPSRQARVRVLWRVLAAVAILAGATVEGFAAVVVEAPTTFVVRHERAIGAPGASLVPALEHVAAWWDAEHTFSGNATNLRLDLRPGGCLCETWPGGFVEHLHVVYANPGIVRFTGAMGPLQELAIAGVLTFAIREADGRTMLVLTYRASGADAKSLERWPSLVDAMLGGVADRLAGYLSPR